MKDIELNKVSKLTNTILKLQVPYYTCSLKHTQAVTNLLPVR